MKKFKQNKYLVADVEFVTCPYCDSYKSEKLLHWKHLERFHNKNMDDVQLEFPDHITMTLEEFNKRCSYAKKGREKSKEKLENEKYKMVKCYYHEDDDCPGEEYEVEIWAPNYVVCDYCKMTGKENPDGRFKEGANIKRVKTFQTRYGKHIKNARDLDGVDDKIKKTSEELYEGIGFGSKILSEKAKETMRSNLGTDKHMEIEEIKNKDLVCKKCGLTKRVAINYENELCKECRDERFPGMLEIDDNTVVCQICFKGFGCINEAHLNSHNITVIDYKNKFPDAPLFCKNYIIKSKLGGSKGRPTGYIIMNCIYCGDLFMARKCSDAYTRCPNCKKEGIPFRGFMGTQEAREKQRKKLLEGLSAEMNSGNHTISKPQRALFDIIKGYYTDAILNDPFKEINRTADISIPSIKIIIESDGSYFHKDKDDNYRDFLFNNIGWRVIRFKNIDIINNLPPEEDIIEYIDSFSNSSDDVLIIE